MGVAGRRATTNEEFEEAINWALQLKQPVVIECIIDPDEKVWPMVAPGTSIADAFSEEDM
jgi:acetolactate synthase-1/2/3 large subunit